MSLRPQLRRRLRRVHRYMIALMLRLVLGLGPGVGCRFRPNHLGEKSFEQAACCQPVWGYGKPEGRIQAHTCIMVSLRVGSRLTRASGC